MYYRVAVPSLFGLPLGSSRLVVVGGRADSLEGCLRGATAHVAGDVPQGQEVLVLKSSVRRGEGGRGGEEECAGGRGGSQRERDRRGHQRAKEIHSMQKRGQET